MKKRVILSPSIDFPIAAMINQHAVVVIEVEEKKSVSQKKKKRQKVVF